MKTLLCALLAILASVTVNRPLFGRQSPPTDLLTEAERSDYTATARYEQVVSLCDRIAAASKLVHVTTMGTTVQGRSLPLLIVADPPISTPEEARRSGKVVMLFIGNIHAGEVCGKEALPALVRDIVLAKADGTDEEKPLRNLLKDVVLLVAPIYNADGNENLGTLLDKRGAQNGPSGGDGVGTRENADNLDLNRDYVKLESPEARALVRLMRQWDPAVFVDTHTTNGSHHRYVITYMGPTSPTGDAAILSFVRDRYLPDIGAKLKARTGFDSFFYGNLAGRQADGDYTQWTTYPDLPRYGGPYIGLRNRISLLSEAYAYAPYKDRVIATYEFCRASIEFASANKAEIQRLIREADEAAINAGRNPADSSELPIRTEARAFDKKETVLGFVEETRDGKRVATETHREYQVELINNFVPTTTVKRPFAYVYPRSLTKVTETLQRHGIDVQELREDIEIDVESYRIESVTKAMRAFQGHELVDVKVSPALRSERMPAGTMVVRTAQKLGTLAAYLLEPHAADGLTTWNFFDDALALGEFFPVSRMLTPAPILTTPTRPLSDERELGKRITYDTLYARSGINLSGSPLGGLRWIDVGEKDDTYLMVREGKAFKVDALTGRAEPYMDRGPIVASLAKISTISESAAGSLGNATFLNMDNARTGALFNYENDLYYAAIDGSGARRLTNTPEPEEDAAWSPDGKFVAFTRGYDLYVVDVSIGVAGGERRLTTGGHSTLRNGRNDWVYFEEIFNRNWRAFWWSPDSRRIAFLQIDSSLVPEYPLPADHEEPRRIETERYPRPGDPNPSAKLGIVTVAGGDVRWADLSNYDHGSFLITSVGWLSPRGGNGEAAPESKTAYCTVQNRTQTWLDFVAIPASGGSQKVLLRETTKAWVEPQGDPYVLKDGSFILTSERDGYRHLYLYAADGKLRNRITEGEWEARSIAHVDEKNGFVYFNATERSWIGSNLYRVNINGEQGSMKLISSSPIAVPGSPSPVREGAIGSHAVNFAPSGRYYIDTWSDSHTPTRVALFDSAGAMVRMLDTNPVYTLEEYIRGDLERHTITLSDGFKLEASILKPPGFSPLEKYPVWLMTYAGPHAPSVNDTWSGGRTYDEMLASEGIVVFRVDPRSASGKGAVSAWSAYKQLGVQELKDLEEAVKWLADEKERPWIDASRVGLAGASYGGFMTAYALTHSKVFAAGIATASVTDWREYDSIYTERYMLTPQENPEGYDATSVVKAARNLHGRLLLVHGTLDDNVHPSNSIKLARALQDASKQFDFMLYPGARHGVGGEHVRRMNYDFIRRHLLGK